MKKFFKIILLTIIVFWGTIVILEAKESVEKYVLKNKKEVEIVETSNFISKKGKGFVEYIIVEINTISNNIKELTGNIKSSNSTDKNYKKIQELKKLNLGLKEILEKKPFIGLDDFIANVNDFSLLVDDYINLINDNKVDIKVFKERQSKIEEKKINIEELIKTIEVN